MRGTPGSRGPFRAALLQGPAACGARRGGQEGPSSVVDDGGRRVAEQVGLDDLDVLLGHLPVDYPEAPELDVVALEPGPLPVVAGGDERVARVGRGRLADVGPPGERPGGGVRVVDDVRFFGPAVHLPDRERTRL